MGGGRNGLRDQKVQSFSYKISHGDVMYSLLTIDINTVLLRGGKKELRHKELK